MPAIPFLDGRTFVLAALCCGCVSLGGEFVNLGFDEPDLSQARLFRPESAPLEVGPLLYAPVQDAFRGWTISYPLDGWPYYGLVDVSLGGNKPFSLMSSLYGTYELGVSMFAYYEEPRNSFSVSQRGLVPEGAGLLHLAYYTGWGMPDMQVQIDGVQQPLIIPRRGKAYVDVSPFAGQEVELRFGFPPLAFYGLDIIGFEPIPEPSTWAMVALGGGVMWFALRGGRRSRTCRR
jgi:hypothetical protein